MWSFGPLSLRGLGFLSQSRAFGGPLFSPALDAYDCAAGHSVVILRCGVCRKGRFGRPRSRYAQGAQDGLRKECGLNYMGIQNMI